MTEQTYTGLNASLNIPENGQIMLEKDKEAAKAYFLEHVNQNTMFFHDLEEKLNYLIDEGYYDPEVFKPYSDKFIKDIYKKAYGYKFRFPGFVPAYKFYSSYALKTRDGERYLERFEDRVVINALSLARGNRELATSLVDEVMNGRLQPATPTFLNTGRAAAGELVSCYLLRIEDNMESIGEAVRSSLQLSKRGGGVALCLSNIREFEAPIKGIEKAASGVVPVMKILEDTFSYANQLGQRQGAGAVYLHVNHPDIMRFLDTKKENADEKVRIKTLSLGVIVPDIAFELARNNEDMYLFSPHDVKNVYGCPFTEISVTEKYREMVDNKNIRKTKISARALFQKIAEIQFESGYPYIMYEDTVNRAHAPAGRVSMSNLCIEIMQESSPNTFDDKGGYEQIGRDISCNLASQNIAKVMDGGDIGKSVNIAIRALTAVSDMSNVSIVPSIKNGNDKSHSVGLGQMNLHGFLAREKIHYGSPESIDFVSAYFAAVAFHSIKASNEIATERKKVFDGFSESKYATGEYFDKYVNNDWLPTTYTGKQLFQKFGIELPTKEDWKALKEKVMETGMYNKYLRAVPPTGSISYVNNSTSSIHPITSKIEIRKEGKTGRFYYPAPYMNNDNMSYYRDAYEIGYEALIDVYAAATEHLDQGLSATLFFPANSTTRDINKAQIMAWKKGMKALYYIRLKSENFETVVCESCSL